MSVPSSAMCMNIVFCGSSDCRSKVKFNTNLIHGGTKKSPKEGCCSKGKIQVIKMRLNRKLNMKYKIEIELW